MNVSADDLLTITLTGGGVVVGLAAVIGAFVQIRSWIVGPFERIEVGMRRIEQDVSKLQLHFDPNGGDLRTRLAQVEKRVASIESTNIAERAALRTSLHDLKSVADELSDRNTK